MIINHPILINNQITIPILGSSGSGKTVWQYILWYLYAKSRNNLILKANDNSLDLFIRGGCGNLFSEWPLGTALTQQYDFGLFYESDKLFDVKFIEYKGFTKDDNGWVDILNSSEYLSIVCCISTDEIKSIIHDIGDSEITFRAFRRIKYLINRLLVEERKLPLCFILTKVDLLDNEELSIAYDIIKNHFNYLFQNQICRVFPVKVQIVNNNDRFAEVSMPFEFILQSKISDMKSEIENWLWKIQETGIFYNEGLFQDGGYNGVDEELRRYYAKLSDLENGLKNTTK